MQNLRIINFADFFYCFFCKFPGIIAHSVYIKEAQKPIKFIPYFLTEVDYRANIHNKEAISFYEKIGTKVIETSFESKKPNRQIALMRCKHCLKYALNICKSPKNIILKDEKGTVFPLKFDCKSCEMSVMSPN